MFILIRYLSFITGLFFVINGGYAQDPVFSQFYASGLYLNPAMAGVEPNWTLAMNHRNRWVTHASDPYVTTQASLIMPFYRKDMDQRHWGGAGLSVFNDRSGAGLFRSTGASVSLAYNVPLASMHSLLLSGQLGVLYKSVNNSLKWGEQYNPDAPGGLDPVAAGQMADIYNAKVMPDVGAGFMYYYNSGRDYTKKGVSAYIGAAASHLNEPNESLLRGERTPLPILIKAHAGFEVSLSRYLNISPNMIYATQDQFYQVNAGAYFTFNFLFEESMYIPKSLIIGGWYRLEDAVIASIGLSNDFFTLGFSYDMNSNDLRYPSPGKGAYEISLKITKPHPSKTVRFYTPRI